ncbi:MAG: hypothetical protein QM756_35005 [Polyangiaceae bacterium]
MRSLCRAWLGSIFVLCACSAGSTSGSGGAPGSGGVQSNGGSSNAGGATTGSSGSGQGGSASLGGAPANGGSISSGGSANGGSSVSTGGSTSASGGTSSGGSANGGSTNGGSSNGGSSNGGSSVSTGGASGAGPCSAKGLLFCETFDDRTAGQIPSGAPFLARNCFASGLTLQVDATQSHSGKQSFMSQNVPYGDCMLHISLGTLTDYWVRSWVRFAKGDATQFGAHEVVVYDLTPTTSTDDPGIRVGFRGDNSCQPTGAEVNITGGEEKTGCTGFQFEADKWYCLEVHVAPSGAGVTTDMYIDGADQSYSVHGTATTTVDNPNYPGAKFLRLGVRSYSNAYNFPIYVDDLAAGTERIGCN